MNTSIATSSINQVVVSSSGSDHQKQSSSILDELEVVQQSKTKSTAAAAATTMISVLDDKVANHHHHHPSQQTQRDGSGLVVLAINDDDGISYSSSSTRCCNSCISNNNDDNDDGLLVEDSKLAAVNKKKRSVAFKDVDDDDDTLSTTSTRSAMAAGCLSVATVPRLPTTTSTTTTTTSTTTTTKGTTAAKKAPSTGRLKKYKDDAEYTIRKGIIETEGKPVIEDSKLLRSTRVRCQRLHKLPDGRLVMIAYDEKNKKILGLDPLPSKRKKVFKSWIINFINGNNPICYPDGTPKLDANKKPRITFRLAKGKTGHASPLTSKDEMYQLAQLTFGGFPLDFTCKKPTELAEFLCSGEYERLVFEYKQKVHNNELPSSYPTDTVDERAPWDFPFSDQPLKDVDDDMSTSSAMAAGSLLVTAVPPRPSTTTTTAAKKPTSTGKYKIPKSDTEGQRALLKDEKGGRLLAGDPSPGTLACYQLAANLVRWRHPRVPNQLLVRLPKNSNEVFCYVSESTGEITLDPGPRSDDINAWLLALYAALCRNEGPLVLANGQSKHYQQRDEYGSPLVEQDGKPVLGETRWTSNQNDFRPAERKKCFALLVSRTLKVTKADANSFFDKQERKDELQKLKQTNFFSRYMTKQPDGSRRLVEDPNLLVSDHVSFDITPPPSPAKTEKKKPPPAASLAVAPPTHQQQQHHQQQDGGSTCPMVPGGWNSSARRTNQGHDAVVMQGEDDYDNSGYYDDDEQVGPTLEQQTGQRPSYGGGVQPLEQQTGRPSYGDAVQHFADQQHQHHHQVAPIPYQRQGTMPRSTMRQSMVMPVCRTPHHQHHGHHQAVASAPGTVPKSMYDEQVALTNWAMELLENEQRLRKLPTQAPVPFGKGSQALHWVVNAKGKERIVSKVSNGYYYFQDHGQDEPGVRFDMLEPKRYIGP